MHVEWAVVKDDRGAFSHWEDTSSNIVCLIWKPVQENVEIFLHIQLLRVVKRNLSAAASPGFS